MSSTRIPRGSSVARVIARSLADIVGLGAPTACGVCRQPGHPVCHACRRALDGPVRRHLPRPSPPGMPVVHVAAAYDSVMRAMLREWKERGRRDIGPVLAGAMARCICVAVDAIPGEAAAGPVASVVPIPASPRARRRRGDDAWMRVVELAVALLAESGTSVRLESCLRLTRQPRDQSGLGASQRRGNLAGALACDRPPLGRVVIVDDIVTTGATIAEAARALRMAGCPEPRAAALAATLRSGRCTPSA